MGTLAKEVDLGTLCQHNFEHNMPRLIEKDYPNIYQYTYVLPSERWSASQHIYVIHNTLDILLARLVLHVFCL